MMADKPIIFSAPMVRALLDGRKTQTRRIVRNVPDAPAMDNIAWTDKKLHPAPYLDAYCGAKRTPENPRGMTANWAYWTRDDRPGPLFKVGYAPGDRLYVREAWQAHSWAADCVTIRYRAEERSKGFNDQIEQIKYPNGKKNALKYIEPKGPYHWRPSIHMPRWASRLTLTVTDVRVQRLQEITLGDICAEGLAASIYDFKPVQRGFDAWADLWDSLHGPEAWEANPWVCAITFTVHKCNIDQMERADV